MKTFLTFFAIIPIIGFSQNDSLRINSVEEKVTVLSERVQQISRDQLNYTIEKNLLKETYSNNYERINFVLTVILGIICILGYLGIRDISTIKKEYNAELESLRSLKTEFDIKSKSFDVEKTKFETEIKEIIKQNEQQNTKIKVLELKEKISTLLKDKQNISALEYCNVGIELAPDDPYFINVKAILKCRFNDLNEALELFKQVTTLEPSNVAYTINYIECLLFCNQIKPAKELIGSYEKVLTQKEHKLLQFLQLIENYHTKGDAELLESIIPLLDFTNVDSVTKHFKYWNLTEALYFASHQPDGNKKVILQHILWYLDGVISTKTICNRLSIPIEKYTTNNQ